MIGHDFIQDQVKRFSVKDVENFFKRCETSLSSRTCDAMVDTFLQLSRRVIANFLPVDQEKLLKDLNENFMVKRELSMIAGRLSLNYGRYIPCIRSPVKSPVTLEKPSLARLTGLFVRLARKVRPGKAWQAWPGPGFQGHLGMESPAFLAMK